MKRLFYIAIITFLAVGCHNHTTRNDDQLKTIRLKENIQDTINADKVFRSINYITLVTPDSVLMGYPAKIIKDRNRIFVSDGSKVFVFDKGGKYVMSVSREGRGPSEHQSVRDFSVDGDNVYIIDSTPCLFKYSIDGVFLDKQPLGSFAATVQPIDEDKLVVTSAYQNKEDKFRMFREVTLKETSSYFPVNEAEMKYRQLLNQNNFFVYDGSLLYHERWNNYVYLLKTNGYKIIYHFDFFGRNIPEDFLHAKYSDVVDFSMKLRDKSYCYLLNDYAESDNSILMSISDCGKCRMCLYDKKVGTSIQFNYIILRPGSSAVSVGTIPANFYSEDSMFFTLGEDEDDAKVQICEVRLK